MRKFIITILKFGLPILAFFIMCSFLLKKMVDTTCSYQLEKKYTTIILGHSQPEHAFNDSLIQNTKNLCSGGEAYVYTFQKLKKITSQNPQITTVLLSFSNNQIEEKMTDWTFNEESMNQYYSKYSFEMDKEDYFLFFKNSFKNLLIAELKGIVFNAKCVLKKENRIQNHDFGGYLFSKRMKTDSLISHHYIDEIKKEQTNIVSDVNLSYLKKIVNFCKEKNIKLLFFRTPIHPLLFKIQDENRFQKIRKENFGAIPFIDLYNFPITNEEFGDFSHLNYKGARKVSLYFNDLLKKNYQITTN